MSEVFRFQLARSPQRKSLDETGLLKLYPSGPSSFFNSLKATSEPDTIAEKFLSGLGWLAPARQAAIPELTALDDTLRKNGNKVDPNAIIQALQSATPQDDFDIHKFQSEMLPAREKLADALTATLLLRDPVNMVTSELRGDLVRKLTLFGLIDLLQTSPKAVSTPDAVSAALRDRILVLPEDLANISENQRISLHGRTPQLGRSRRHYVTRTGVSDLYIVKSEWIRYEAGEIAHIENVLPRELKHREHIRTDEREETATRETETTSFNEQDTQSSDRFEVSDEASRDTATAAHADGQVNTSGQYGPTKVDTHIGGSLDFSQQDSQSRASKQSRETISRAITRVEQRVREARTTRTLTRIQETNTHSLDNTSSLAISGIYRWVDKVQRFQIFRYPNRLLLEFQLPEPAAWWRWMIGSATARGLRTKPPKPFTASGRERDDNNNILPELTFADIQPANYAALAARYGALGLEPPPPAKRIVTDTFVVPDTTQTNQNAQTVTAPTTGTEGNNPKNYVHFMKAGPIAIPTGYAAKRWWWWPEGVKQNGGMERSMLAVLGGAVALIENPNDGEWTFAPGNRRVGPFGITRVGDPEFASDNVDQSALSFFIRWLNLKSFGVTITMECEATAATLDKWRIATFERIEAAYHALKREHEEEIAAASIRAGVVIEGDSPTRNAEVIREQLKLGALRQLFGDASGSADLPFTWIDLVDRSDAARGPQPKADAAALRSPLIQFLEHAFEWDKLTYVLYPYFWAADWPATANIKSSDAEFARFLRSGSARVVAPVRPGFEAQVGMFLDFGVIWGGGTIPAIGDPHYLSIADEIRSIHNAPDDGEPLDWWDERLPTTLTWIDGAGTLPEKPASQIKLGVAATPPRKELPAPAAPPPAAPVPVAPPAPHK